MIPLLEWLRTRRALAGEVVRLKEDLRACRSDQEQTRLEAEASVAAKNAYLANLSHDLRTPINAILGFSSLARRMDLPPKTQHYMKRIGKAAEDIRDIINNVLDLSKIEADMMKVDRVEFQLQEMLAKVVNVTALTAAEKGLEFVVAGLETVADRRWGDPLRLGQVLTNLVSNAIKFTPAGHVVVRLAADPGRKDAVRFEVEDSGIGIGADQQTHVFQAFAQGDIATARRFGGTGLGLAISRNLVELMGGSLELRSRVGEGTTFSFSLELPPRPGPAQPGPRLRAGARALVAGAPGLTCAALQGILEAQEIQVQSVATGAEAMAALRPRPSEQPFDLVFLNLRAEGLDGLRTAREIRQDPWLKALPIVLLVSSAADQEVEAQAEREGIKVLLTLPALPSSTGEAMVRAAKGPALSEQSTGRIWFGSPEVMRELSGARVLLVDDNLINLELGTDLLALAGIDVTAVSGGARALARMDEGRFDAVLMDLEMPGMDGWETTARIRSRPDDGHTPVIALTAHALAGFREKCLAAGMNDYIAKPFDLPHLFQVLLRWIPARGPSEAPPPAAPGDPRFRGLEQVIAVEQALEHLEGNADLLEKYLKKLYLAPVHSEDEVRAALDRGDLAGAREIVHSSRGLLGMLGLTRVIAAAEALEGCLRDGDRAGAEEAWSRFADGLGEFRKCMETAGRG
jgi:CheY-like chemotaxis protein/nitrogen-specific signal transduction histidine kinase/HPt (histidine-containing phosphotransfer) domain-containing protein